MFIKNKTKVLTITIIILPLAYISANTKSLSGIVTFGSIFNIEN
ncbi:unnamed protein product, partial [marine sediment metagenome]